MTKKERTAYQRAALVKDYLVSGLALAEYCQRHNAALAAKLLEPTALAKQLSVPTLSRWVASYKAGGAQALQPQYQPGKGGGATLSAHQKALLQKYWLNQNKPGIAACCRWIEQQHGVRISYDTARRYLESLPEALKILRREGPNAYKAKVDPSIVKDYGRLEVMQQICADHHTLDIMCVAKPGGKPFRPYLSAYIDMRSRKLLAWAINQHQPDQWVVMQVLDQVIDRHGLPGCIIIDNGKDFIAKNFTGHKVQVRCEFDELVEIEIQGVFGQLGCDVVRTTPYHGQAKWIERLFNFICEDFSKQFPTYTGSNTVTRPEESRLYHRAIGKQAKRNVVLTLDELRSHFDSWAAWYNANWPQRGNAMDGQTADQVYATRRSRVSMPPEFRQRVFCRAEKRLVRRDGIQIDNTSYYNAEIVAEYLRRDVVVKRPFNDLSKVFIYALDGAYLGEAFTYAGVGLAETGDTERDIAAKKRLAKAVKKTVKAYEEALGEQRQSIERRTIADRADRTDQADRQPPAPLRQAAGAEHLTPQKNSPPVATGGLKILTSLTGDDYDDNE